MALLVPALGLWPEFQISFIMLFSSFDFFTFVFFFFFFFLVVSIADKGVKCIAEVRIFPTFASMLMIVDTPFLNVHSKELFFSIAFCIMYISSFVSRADVFL